MNKFLAALLFLIALSASAQVTITPGSTVLQVNAGAQGVNIGSLAAYGNEQGYADLFYAAGGGMPAIVAQVTAKCDTGGVNDATHVYSNASGANGYPANFWTNATIDVRNASTGATYTTGATRVTTSTSNVSTGTQFVLDTPLSSPCNPSQGDMIIVEQRANPAYYTPQVLASAGVGFQLGSGCSSASWSSDVDAAWNGQHSLNLPSGCTFNLLGDQVLANKTNTNPALTGNTPWINLNGNFTLVADVKCASGAGTFSVNFIRFSGSTFLGSTPETLSCNATPGAGWTTVTVPLPGLAETGNQTGALQLQMVTSAPILVQRFTVVEDTSGCGGTPFRCALVNRLQTMAPKSIRAMSPAQWAQPAADQYAPTGGRRWAAGNIYSSLSFSPSYGLDDMLKLAGYIGSDLLYNVGCLNQPSDWAGLVTWESTNADYIALKNAGHQVLMENCNEAWNSGASPAIYEGNGTIYGTLLGANIIAAKAATGYDSAHMKFVGNNWFAPNQSFGPFGWIHVSLSKAQAQGAGALPDYEEIAPYGCSYLSAFTVSGGNVTTTGEPWDGCTKAEPNNFVSSTPASGFKSIYQTLHDMNANFPGVQTIGYESNFGTQFGTAISQLNLNQVAAGWGSALATASLWTQARNIGMTGPNHLFDIGEQYNGYICSGSGCISGVTMPLWGTERMLSTGPGQTANALSVSKPVSILFQLMNKTIGSNVNLMSNGQTGTPTLNYPGGQLQGSSNTIAPNSAAPLVVSAAYSDGSNHWTLHAFNLDASSHTVTIAGSNSPSGSYTECALGPSNLVTDNNENTYMNTTNSLAPMVAFNYPSGCTTISGATVTLAPYSFYAFTYTAGLPVTATPTFTPTAGSYSTRQRVSIVDATAGAVIYYTVDGSIPTTSSALYTHPLWVAASQTIKALATASGFTNSAVGSATYTVTRAKTVFSLTPTSSSSTPAPYPPDLRPCCGSTVAAMFPSCTTADFTILHSWMSQAAAHGSTLTYTIQGFPTCMTGAGGVTTATPSDLHTSSSCPGVGSGGSTTDCKMKSYVTLLMKDVTGLSSQPSSPVNCPHLDDVETTNEVNTDSPVGSGGSTGWTGLYTDNAAMSNDISTIVHNWCSNTVVHGPSVSGIVGFHSNGENGHYDVALETIYADWAALPSASLPDAASVHLYPSRNNVTPTPFPPSNVNHGGTCTSTSCYVAVKDEVNQINTTAVLQNPAIVAWAKNLPVYSTEGGFGELLQVMGNQQAAITGFSITSNVATFTASNTFTNGQTVYLDGFNTGTYFNDRTVTVLSTGLSGSQFEANFTHADVGTTADSAYAADAPTTVTLRSAYVAESLMAIAPQNPVNHMLYAADDNVWGCYWNCNSTSSPWLGSYNQMLSWLGTVTIAPGAALTSAAVTGGNKWTLPVSYSGNPAELTHCDAWLANCTASTAFNTMQSLAGAVTSLSGTVTLDQRPALLYNLVTATTPSFSPVTGTYTSTQTVTISDATPGAVIYYTVDGSTPTTASAVYGGALTVSATTTVKAIATATGYAQSAVGTATYTITAPVPSAPIALSGILTN